MKKACEMLKKEFQGSVPSDYHSLIRLPGVSQKTANILIGEIFPFYGNPSIDSRGMDMAIVHGMLDMNEFVRKGQFVDSKITPERVERSLQTWLPHVDRRDFNKIQASWAHLVTSPLLVKQNELQFIIVWLIVEMVRKLIVSGMN